MIYIFAVMILFITNRCNSECSHCMSCCTAEGIDMTDETLIQAIKFINEINPFVVSISGGEPTLHKNIIPIIERLQKELTEIPHIGIRPRLTLITNGTFCKDNRNLRDKIKHIGISVQITHDDRFYKNSLTNYDLCQIPKLFIIEQHVAHVLAYGNALQNNLPTSKTRIAPYCFNMRSLVNISNFDFKQAVQEMEGRMKFCQWAVKPDGSIILSEAMGCPAVGTVYDSIPTITQNIVKLKCKNCIYAKTMVEKGVVAKDVYQKIFE